MKNVLIWSVCWFFLYVFVSIGLGANSPDITSTSWNLLSFPFSYVLVLAYGIYMRKNDFIKKGYLIAFIVGSIFLFWYKLANGNGYFGWDFWYWELGFHFLIWSTLIISFLFVVVLLKNIR